MTTDGQYVGLRLSGGSEDFARAAFYSEVEEDREFGFKYLGMGDVWVQCRMDKETGELVKMWFDGDMYRKPDGTEMKCEKEVFTKWFYLVDIEKLMQWYETKQSVREIAKQFPGRTVLCKYP